MKQNRKAMVLVAVTNDRNPSRSDPFSTCEGTVRLFWKPTDR
ncbi:MAG TPA: hypothetical protein VFJ51_04920 [Nitrososphaeraceae archaeon]|nr:hypothetical protein [Nitrososphaeraceae archaeon]